MREFEEIYESSFSNELEKIALSPISPYTNEALKIIRASKLKDIPIQREVAGAISDLRGGIKSIPNVISDALGSPGRVLDRVSRGASDKVRSGAAGLEGIFNDVKDYRHLGSVAKESKSRIKGRTGLFKGLRNSGDKSKLELALRARAYMRDAATANVMEAATSPAAMKAGLLGGASGAGMLAYNKLKNQE